MTTTWLGIDATNWVHVLWHAQGGRRVVPAVVERAKALIERLEPQHAIACFDRHSFRHALSPRYKASRAEKDEGLLEALKETEAALSDVCEIAAQEPFEADDCLATLAALGTRCEIRVIVASPDKDLRQCLSEHVLILRKFVLSRGQVGDGDWYRASDLWEKYGLRPDQWPDYQALCGDRGDGVSGCEGWGPVTVQRALQKCGSLANLLENPWKVRCSDRQRGALVKFRKQAETELQLVTLKTNVEAVFDALR